MLGVLVLVYIFNFLDRQIISILAERIKADLQVSDAEIGFLYGTAFAVFFAVFGIPLARLADVWERRAHRGRSRRVELDDRVVGARPQLRRAPIARFGVGIGEASASPAAFSLLSDSFPAARRATALAVYSSGIYIGAGLGIGLGGWVVERWDHAFAGVPPFGLRGWQAAFLAAGLPGLLLAVWVATLREPRRGSADGIFSPTEPHPFREFFFELRSVLPPFTLLHLALIGAGRRVLARNLCAALLIVAIATLLIRATHTPSQWIALGVGVYAAFSWSTGSRLP